MVGRDLDTTRAMDVVCSQCLFPSYLSLLSLMKDSDADFLTVVQTRLEELGTLDYDPFAIVFPPLRLYFVVVMVWHVLSQLSNASRNTVNGPNSLTPRLLFVL